MKKLLIAIIFLTLAFSSVSYAQTVCPAPVTTFNFTFTRPVVANQKIGGASVCDPDVGQTATWAITTGNTSNLWKISNGNILVNDATAVNNSTLTAFTITIQVTDNGVPPLSSTATVNMNESNNPPSIADQAFAVNENSANGTVVGTIIATDPDAGQTKTFSILSGNTSGAFSVNASTGVIVVSNMAALNYEVTPQFILVVKVQDNGTGSLSSQANITININNVNEAPVIYNQP